MKFEILKLSIYPTINIHGPFTVDVLWFECLNCKKQKQTGDKTDDIVKKKL